MGDTQAPLPVPSQSLITSTLIVYILFGAAAVIAILSHGFPPVAPLGGIVGIVGIIMAYVKRAEAAGTWLASHYRWLIRTFWFSLLWGLIGLCVFLVLAIVFIGFIIGPVIWIATALWVIYRIVRGYLLFNESKPVPGM